MGAVKSRLLGLAVQKVDEERQLNGIEFAFAGSRGCSVFVRKNFFNFQLEVK